MVATNRAYHDKLLDIGSIARCMKSLCGVDPHPRPVTTKDTITTPPLFLLSPDPLIPLLTSHGYPYIAAQTLSDTFLRSAHQIQTRLESNYRETCAKLAPYLMSDPVAQTARYRSLASLVESQYEDQISTIKGLALEHIKAYQQRSLQKNTTKNKPTFNQEYVPLLEKYFEYNAYPSAQDRSALARKSMMTPRQIEVWFQNHRNRFKKEGKALRRLTSVALPHRLSLEPLEKSMPLSASPEEQRGDPSDSTSRHGKNITSEEESNTTALPQTSFTFDYTAPPHAFPTPYSQTSLTTKQCIFPTPVWMRCRSTIRPFRMVSTMEDLIADFTLKLVVTEPSSKQLRENHQSSSILKLPWFAATYTLPPPAPHPAFIPTTICGTSASLPFSSISHPSMLASKSNSNIAYRKIAHPPKRMPKHRSIAHHEASPTTSQTLSSFTSSSSTSRPRSPSSSSSTSSNTSSTLTTPILSPISLPENAQLPISISGIDFQNVDDPFYDYPTTVPALDEIDLHSFSHATLPPKKLFQLDLETPASHTR